MGRSTGCFPSHSPPLNPLLSEEYAVHSGPDGYSALPESRGSKKNERILALSTCPFDVKNGNISREMRVLFYVPPLPLCPLDDEESYILLLFFKIDHYEEGNDSS